MKQGLRRSLTIDALWREYWGERKNKMRESKIFNFLELIYPGRCPICECILGIGQNKICKVCDKSLSYVKEPKCKKCGKSIEGDDTEYCYDCTRHQHDYEQGVAVFEYDEHIKASIYRFKYKNKREYANFYVQEIVRCYGDKIRSWNPDILIPIPLHKSKYKKRGFNQAEIVAKKVGKELQIPVSSKILMRQKKTLPQKELTTKERQNNVKRAFKIVDNKVKLQVVVLIDDIYTTGSTIDAAAKVLKEAGAYKVYYISISIGKGI